MSMYKIPYRKKLRMATLSAELVGKFRYVWKNTRKYTTWTIKIFNKVNKIADKLNIKKPTHRVKMEEEY